MTESINDMIDYNEEKEKRNKRFMQKQRHINRQVALKKQYVSLIDLLENIKSQPHRYHKVKSMNCGDPNCAMCGNPRKFFNEVTVQEKKFNEHANDEMINLNFDEVA